MKNKTVSKLINFLPPVITAVCIIVFTIIYKQALWKIVPLMVSLVVMLFNSKANRYGLLIGAINSLFYTAVNISERLFGSALSAFYSAILSFLGFLRWRKRSYGKATVFKRLPLWAEIVGTIGFIGAWLGFYFILSATNDALPIQDSLSTVMGLILPILNMFAFIDLVPLQMIHTINCLIIWIVLVVNGNLAGTTYIVISVYNLIMSAKMCARWIILYKEQKHALPIEGNEKGLD